jgi:biopolymer transport protein ExbD
MAEINISLKKSKAGVPRAKKLSTKVDLTPMVDLGFLLITFFIVTTTWSQPGAMPLNMPSNGDSSNISKQVVLTLIAAANDKIFYYDGELDDASKKNNYGVINYSINGLGEIIREKQMLMDKSYKGGRKEMMVLIKATPRASYQNVVNLLDEMAIDAVSRYSVIEITENEKKLLQQKRID